MGFIALLDHFSIGVILHFSSINQFIYKFPEIDTFQCPIFFLVCLHLNIDHYSSQGTWWQNNSVLLSLLFLTVFGFCRQSKSMTLMIHRAWICRSINSTNFRLITLSGGRWQQTILLSRPTAVQMYERYFVFSFGLPTEMLAANLFLVIQFPSVHPCHCFDPV